MKILVIFSTLSVVFGAYAGVCNKPLDKKKNGYYCGCGSSTARKGEVEKWTNPKTKKTIFCKKWKGGKSEKNNTNK